jgi:hypothetical protein
MSPPSCSRKCRPLHWPGRPRRDVPSRPSPPLPVAPSYFERPAPLSSSVLSYSCKIGAAQLSPGNRALCGRFLWKSEQKNAVARGG